MATSTKSTSLTKIRVIRGPRAIARVVKSATGKYVANIYFGGKGKEPKKLVTPLGGIDLAAMKTQSPMEAVRKACFSGRLALLPKQAKA
jgi:hypothetical protein